ncbi:hypothetical protein [Pleionea sediminis]|uniref:hypothetical protein n=1 Tax=Pleionea sediminis TaxID=2569479 RepID=UPI0011855C4C|nr:hypothetical protein [Pleionea sediminis]
MKRFRFLTIFILTALLSFNVTASEKTLADVKQLSLNVEGMSPKGVVNNQLYFARFEGFTELLKVLVEALNTPAIEPVKAKPLFTFDASFTESNQKDLLVEVGESWIRVEDKNYDITEKQYDRIIELVALRLTDEELAQLLSEN